MYLRYPNSDDNIETVDVAASNTKPKKEEKSKLQIVAGIICAMYLLEYSEQHYSAYLDEHPEILYIAFVGLIVFNYIIERLHRWISK